MTEKILFNDVFDSFQARYEGLEMKDTYVYYKGELQFNTDGYSLLFNLYRLCETLKGELR